jgi:ribosomal protein S18 acetylase RimI-like enzyme
MRNDRFQTETAKAGQEKRKKMLVSIRMRFYQVLEAWRGKGFSAVRRELFYQSREAILTRKGLTRLKPPRTAFEKTGLEFMELSGSAARFGHLRYSLRSRKLKMIRNLKKGYRSFAFVEGSEVIGDVWYCIGSKRGEKPAHPDIKWLGMAELGETEVYMFDFYIRPDKRKGGLVNIALSQALNTFKERGYDRVYGFYMADNLPALWMHRSAGYEEISRLKIRRSFRGIQPVAGYDGHGLRFGSDQNFGEGVSSGEVLEHHP